jgi:hypothetical protein
MADDKAKVTPPADEVQGAESAEQTTASVPAEKGDEKPAEKAGETTGKLLFGFTPFINARSI